MFNEIRQQRNYCRSGGVFMLRLAPCLNFCRARGKFSHRILGELQNIPHDPAGADKSEGGGGLGVVGLWIDWPERLLPMWLETLREQSRIFCFLKHGDMISEGGQPHPGQRHQRTIS